MQREDVDDGVLVVDVLRHAGRVLGEALRVDQPVEGVDRRGHREGDVLGVAGDADVANDISCGKRSDKKNSA